MKVIPVKTPEGKYVHYTSSLDKPALCGCNSSFEVDNKGKRCQKCEYLVFKNSHAIDENAR